MSGNTLIGPSAHIAKPTRLPHPDLGRRDQGFGLLVRHLSLAARMQSARTAEALGIAVLLSLLARADEVIE